MQSVGAAVTSASEVIDKVRFPRSMMMIQYGNSIERKLVWISTMVALLVVDKRASADRAIRIVDAAASMNSSKASVVGAGKLLAVGTDCAVLYEDPTTVFYGRVVRYGFVKSTGSVVDIVRPLNLDERDENVGVWCAWYELVDGGPNPQYRLTSKDVLQSGMSDVVPHPQYTAPTCDS
jgi:hypothetical protein